MFVAAQFPGLHTACGSFSSFHTDRSPSVQAGSIPPDIIIFKVLWVSCGSYWARSIRQTIPASLFMISTALTWASAGAPQDSTSKTSQETCCLSEWISGAPP